VRRKQEAAERKEAEVVLTQGRASFQEHDDCNHYYSGTTCVVIRIPFDAAWSTEACKI
jgi:hypothetical protein